jgi:hypothetical protein
MNLPDVVAFAKKYLIPQLNEPATWRGFIYRLTALGIVVDPAMQEAIIAAGLGLAGLIGIFVSEQPAASRSTANTY